MKKTILILCILSLAKTSKSQVTVEGVNINDLKEVKYCEIVGFDLGVFSTRLIVNVDYGQKVKLGESMTIKKANEDKSIVFNSMIDALNFMELNGWEYINQYAITSQNSKIYHILLKRKQ